MLVNIWRIAQGCGVEFKVRVSPPACMREVTNTRAEVHAQTEIDPSSVFACWAAPMGDSADVDLLPCKSSISMLFDMMAVDG